MKIRNTIHQKIMLFLVLVYFNSCYVKGLGIGNKHLSKSEGSFIHNNTTFAPPLFNDSIYLYKASVLKSFLKTIPQTLIYVWSANCKSSNCISLKVCQEYADKNHLYLLVLQEYFDPTMPILNQPIKNALIMADYKHYKTRIADKNTELFLKDLLGKFNYQKDHLSKRFYFFKKDIYNYAKEDIINNKPWILNQ